MEGPITIWDNERYCFAVVREDGTFSISDEYESIQLSGQDMFGLFLMLRDYFSVAPAALADQQER